MKQVICALALLCLPIQAQEPLRINNGTVGVVVAAVDGQGQWYAGGVISKPITVRQALVFARFYDALTGCMCIERQITAYTQAYAPAQGQTPERWSNVILRCSTVARIMHADQDKDAAKELETALDAALKPGSVSPFSLDSCRVILTEHDTKEWREAVRCKTPGLDGCTDAPAFYEEALARRLYQAMVYALKTPHPSQSQMRSGCTVPPDATRDELKMHPFIGRIPVNCTTKER